MADHLLLILKENNWLGEGKNVAFEIEVDEETLEGTFSFTDPNYDFLGNSLSYSLSSEVMINLIKVMKTP